MERTALYALIDMSNSTASLSDDEIDAALRVRSREKASRLAYQAFRGSLELALFSDFDIHGRETLLDLQHRMAKEFLPHGVPDQNDITPLLHIFHENLHGQKVAGYRYLWCDVMSASVFQKLKQANKDDPSSLPKLKKTLSQLLVNSETRLDAELIHHDSELTGCAPDALFNHYRVPKSS